MAKTLLACLIIGFTASAHAATVYDFAGTYRPLFPGPELVPVHFLLTAPSPVTVETTYVPGVALTCDICDQITFFPDASTLTSGTPSSAIGYGIPPGGTVYFYFEPGSFTIDGSHVSILVPGINDAVLNVHGAVAEPSTTVPLLLLASALAVLRPFLRRHLIVRSH